MKSTSIKQLLKLLLLSSVLAIQSYAHAEVKITYYIPDASGSPVAATDEAGKVLWRKHYKPFGEEIEQDAASKNNHIGYTGHVHDRDTGLTYMRARYYDPVVGRFMGMDSAGVNPEDPRTFNRYAYANNNPYKYVDPDGKQALLYAVGIATFGYYALAVAPDHEKRVDSLRQIWKAFNESSGDGDDWESDYEDWANGNSDDATEHGKDRESRGVDKDVTRERGERFRDTQTGGIVYVDGNNVVIDGVEGNVTSWGDQTDQGTSRKVEGGSWEPID